MSWFVAKLGDLNSATWLPIRLCPYSLSKSQSVHIYIKLFLQMMYILLCSCSYDIVTFKGHFSPFKPGVLNIVQKVWNKTVAYSCWCIHFTERPSFEINQIKKEKILCSQQNIQCMSLFLVKYLRSAYEDGLKPC